MNINNYNIGLRKLVKKSPTVSYEGMQQILDTYGQPMIPLKQKTVVRESVNEFKDTKPFTVEKVEKKEEVADVDIFQPTA